MPKPSAASLTSAPKATSLWEVFYRVIRGIPRGRVATYGAIAERAGKPRAARHVGFALAALGGRERHDVPWQRVVGARTKAFGVITIKNPLGGAVQRQLLEREKVKFDERGRISLERYGWPKDGSRLKKKSRKPA